MASGADTMTHGTPPLHPASGLHDPTFVQVFVQKVLSASHHSPRTVSLVGFLVGVYILSRQQHLVRARFYAKVIILVLCGVVSASLGVLAGPLAFLVGKRCLINFIVARTMAFLSQATVGLRYHVEGKEHLNKPTDRPVIYLANHQDALDIVAMGVTFPANVFVLAKRSIQFIPFLGQFMMVADNIFIDRKNKRSAIETMALVADTITKRNAGVWIYPEGTRSGQTNRTMLPFKKGAFYLAVQGHVEIVPIVISTYSPVYDTKNKVFHDGTINIKVLPPIETVGMTIEDVPSLVETVESQMLKTLRELESVPADETRKPVQGGTSVAGEPVEKSANKKSKSKVTAKKNN